jgi:hypothetical protein
MYLLFYSKKCKYSVKFLQLLHDIGEENFFRLVDVAKVNGKLPDMVRKYRVTEVPTIIVNGNFYKGKSAFKWLESKIKNINHQVSSQDTRANKVPVVSGYCPDLNYEGSNTSLSGTTSFAVIDNYQKIETPDAEKEYERTPFELKSDNITNGSIATDDRPDRVSKLDQDLEKLLAERDAVNLDTSKQRRF